MKWTSTLCQNTFIKSSTIFEPSFRCCLFSLLKLFCWYVNEMNLHRTSLYIHWALHYSLAFLFLLFVFAWLISSSALLSQTQEQLGNWDSVAFAALALCELLDFSLAWLDTLRCLDVSGEQNSRTSKWGTSLENFALLSRRRILNPQHPSFVISLSRVVLSQEPQRRWNCLWGNLLADSLSLLTWLPGPWQDSIFLVEKEWHWGKTIDTLLLHWRLSSILVAH